MYDVYTHTQLHVCICTHTTACVYMYTHSRMCVYIQHTQCICFTLTSFGLEFLLCFLQFFRHFPGFHFLKPSGCLQDLFLQDLQTFQHLVILILYTALSEKAWQYVMFMNICVKFLQHFFLLNSCFMCVPKQCSLVPLKHKEYTCTLVFIQKGIVWSHPVVRHIV